MNSGFGLLRFLGALGIVCFHYSPGFRGLVDFFNLLVGLFFILSGFFMSYVDKRALTFDLKNFYYKRAIRIFPIYWLSLLPFLIFGNVDGNVKFIHFFLLQSWFPVFDIVLQLNSPSWFLSVLLFLYSVYPYLRLKSNSFLFRMQYGVFFVVLLIPSEYELFYFPLMFVPIFVFGIRLERLRKILLVDVLLFLILLFFYLKNCSGLLLHSGLMYLPFGILILFILKRSDCLNFGKWNNLIIRLGDSSFSIFLFQASFYALFVEFWYIVNVYGFIVYLLALALFSLAFNRIIEEKMMRWLYKIFRV